MDFWTTFFYIIVMLCVLVGAYFTTRYISGKSRKLFRSKHISLTDRLSVGKDKNIVLIEVGEQNLLIGVTNQSINLIAEIDGNKLKTTSVKSSGTPQKGFAQLRDMFAGAQKAQADLKTARAKARTGSESEDLLGRMDDAIRSRQSRGENNGEDKKQ